MISACKSILHAEKRIVFNYIKIRSLACMRYRIHHQLRCEIVQQARSIVYLWLIRLFKAERVIPRSEAAIA